MYGDVTVEIIVKAVDQISAMLKQVGGELKALAARQEGVAGSSAFINLATIASVMRQRSRPNPPR